MVASGVRAGIGAGVGAVVVAGVGAVVRAGVGAVVGRKQGGRGCRWAPAGPVGVRGPDLATATCALKWHLLWPDQKSAQLS